MPHRNHRLEGDFHYIRGLSVRTVRRLPDWLVTMSSKNVTVLGKDFKTFAHYYMRWRSTDQYQRISNINNELS